MDILKQEPYNRTYTPVTAEPFKDMRVCRHCGQPLYHSSVCFYTIVGARYDPIVNRYVQWIYITPVLEEHLMPIESNADAPIMELNKE